MSTAKPTSYCCIVGLPKIAPGGLIPCSLPCLCYFYCGTAGPMPKEISCCCGYDLITGNAPAYEWPCPLTLVLSPFLCLTAVFINIVGGQCCSCIEDCCRCTTNIPSAKDGDPEWGGEEGEGVRCHVCNCCGWKIGRLNY